MNLRVSVQCLYMFVYNTIHTDVQRYLCLEQTNCQGSMFAVFILYLYINLIDFLQVT